MKNSGAKLLAFLIGIAFVVVLLLLTRDPGDPAEESSSQPEITVTPEATATAAPTPTPVPTDPLDLTVSNGVTLRKFIDRTVQIAMNEPKDAVQNGATKYGARFGTPTYAWCTEFVMWCLEQAEKELGTDFIGSAYPWADSSWGVRVWAKAREGRYFTPKDGYLPQKGDIILFDTCSGGTTDHTGLVIGTREIAGETYILTIEGNIPTDKEKRIRTRYLSPEDPTIFCYCTPVQR